MSDGVFKWICLLCMVLRKLGICLICLGVVLGLEMAVQSRPNTKLTYAQYLAKVQKFFNATDRVGL